MKIATCIALCALMWPSVAEYPTKSSYAPYRSPEAAKMAFVRAEQESARMQLEAERLEAIKADPIAYLQYAGEQRGLQQWEIDRLDAVMSCESRYCADLDNPVSSASGCFQIINGTWNAYSEWPWSDRYDHIKNIDTALNLYQQSGIHHWSSCL